MLDSVSSSRWWVMRLIKAAVKDTITFNKMFWHKQACCPTEFITTQLLLVVFFGLALGVHAGNRCLTLLIVTIGGLKNDESN